MKWVSVKERLPETTEDVLVIDEMGEMSVDWMEWLNIKGTKRIWSENEKTATKFEITHWMPLPTGPKEQP